MNKTNIGWCTHSWNPFNGCTRYSLGCKNCYAFRDYNLHKKTWAKKYPNGMEVVTVHTDMLREPYKLKEPAKIFVGSTGDIFHKDMPLDFLQRLFRVMNDNQHLVFQLLTKRAERMVELASNFNFTPNIWVGVTIEHNDYCYRANLLRQVPASVKFISAEPLLNDLSDLNIDGIDWLIAQGESGANARPVELEWLTHLREMAQNNNIPFYFKKWGGSGINKKSELLEGLMYKEFPKNVYCLKKN